jgi:hypothetical protein
MTDTNSSTTARRKMGPSCGGKISHSRVFQECAIYDLHKVVDLHPVCPSKSIYNKMLNLCSIIP